MHMQFPIMFPTQALKREQIVLELLKRRIYYWKLKAKSLQNGKITKNTIFQCLTCIILCIIESIMI